jgi:tetratricopeptide (TPR) repeat protein
MATVALGLVLIIAGQAITGAMISEQEGVAQTAGRAGFAYLTGIRTFAAAVIWNRLDPIFHGYYDDVPLDQQLNLVPMVYMVNSLDPQFVDGYYISAWILFRRGDVEQAYEIAQNGVENNPDSGLLRTSYAQILYLNGDIDEAAEQAEVALHDSDWRNDEERFEGLRVAMSIFHTAGMTDLHDEAAAEHEELKEAFGLPTTDVPHDHDGDGVPDH